MYVLRLQWLCSLHSVVVRTRVRVVEYVVLSLRRQASSRCAARCRCCWTRRCAPCVRRSRAPTACCPPPVSGLATSSCSSPSAPPPSSTTSRSSCPQSDAAALTAHTRVLIANFAFFLYSDIQYEYCSHL